MYLNWIATCVVNRRHYQCVSVAAYICRVRDCTRCTADTSLGPNHPQSSQRVALLVKNTKALYLLSLELLTPIFNYCMRQKRSAINYISTYLDIISLTPSQREAAGASGLISNYQLHRTQRERGTPVVLIHNAEWYNKMSTCARGVITHWW